MMTMNIFIYESYPEEGIGPCPVIVEVFHHQLVVVQRPKLTACLTIIFLVRILVMRIMMIMTIKMLMNTISYFYVHIFEAFFCKVEGWSIYFTHIYIVPKYAFNVCCTCQVLTAWAKV